MFRRQPNGLDELNRTLVITGLVATILSFFFFPQGSAVRTVISIVASACLILFIIRMFAGHPEKRSTENMKFLSLVTGVRDWFKRLFKGGADRPKRARKARKNPTWAEIKQYKYFICPQCAQRLRVPRGKGKLRVTCTHCGNIFEIKS